MIRSKVANNKFEKNGDFSWQVSSAKYSDLSSMEIDKSRHIFGDYQEDVNVFSPVPVPSNLNKKTKSANNYDVDLGDIRLDSQEFTQYFYENQSLLSLEGVMPQDQFRIFARELQIDPQQRETIAYKFYNKGKQTKAPRSSSYLSKYYVDYLQWKQREQVQQKPIEKTKSSKDTKDTKEHIISKQIEFQSYRTQLEKEIEQRSYKEMKDRLKDISEEYSKKIGILLTKQEPKQDSFDIKQNQKSRQLGFEKIEYPEFQAVNFERMQTNGRRAMLQKQKQINSRSFVDMIKKPPRSQRGKNNTDRKLEEELNYQSFQNPTNMKKEIQKEKKKQLALNVEQVLKMPHRQFLLFYNYYQPKLAALSSPEQMKKLIKYRKEALERYEAIEKLKQKISNSNGAVIRRLSPQKKQMLFKILYQEDVQNQKEKVF